jgi:hypothetical protein
VKLSMVSCGWDDITDIVFTSVPQVSLRPVLSSLSQSNLSEGLQYVRCFWRMHLCMTGWEKLHVPGREGRSSSARSKSVDETSSIPLIDPNRRILTECDGPTFSGQEYGPAESLFLGFTE